MSCPQLAADIFKADSPQFFRYALVQYLAEPYFQQPSRNVQPFRHIGDANSFTGVETYDFACGRYDASTAFYVLRGCSFNDGFYAVCQNP